MADYATAVAESLRLFGVAPSDKWQEYAWNAFLWGEGTNKIVVHPEVPMVETVTPSDAISEAAVALTVAEALAMAGAPTSETLQDSQGYVYIFPSNADDGEERDPVSWSSAAAVSVTWTSGTVSAGSWSSA